ELAVAQALVPGVVGAAGLARALEPADAVVPLPAGVGVGEAGAVGPDAAVDHADDQAVARAVTVPAAGGAAELVPEAAAGVQAQQGRLPQGPPRPLLVLGDGHDVGAGPHLGRLGGGHPGGETAERVEVVVDLLPADRPERGVVLPAQVGDVVVHLG